MESLRISIPQEDRPGKDLPEITQASQGRAERQPLRTTSCPHLLYCIPPGPCFNSSRMGSSPLLKPDLSQREAVKRGVREENWHFLRGSYMPDTTPSASPPLLAI